MRRINWALLVSLATVSMMTSCVPVSLRGTPSPSTEGVADSEISANVALALYDDGLPGWEKIRVATTAGRVVLTGRLEDPEVERRAVAIARDVRGVVFVESWLSAEPGSLPTGSSAPVIPRNEVKERPVPVVGRD